MEGSAEQGGGAGRLGRMVRLPLIVVLTLLAAALFVAVGCANGLPVAAKPSAAATSVVTPTAGEDECEICGHKQPPWPPGGPPAAAPPAGTRIPASPGSVSRDATLTREAPATPGCGLAWYGVDTPSQVDADNSLVVVSAIAENDVWAAGHYVTTSGAARAVALHWDGTQWTTANPVQVGNGNNYVVGLKAVASDNVLAVGKYFDSGSGYYKNLMERWNGNAWSVVSVPNLTAGDNTLKDIAALSATSIWVVGYACPGSCTGGADDQRTQILRWDGNTWTIVPSPNRVGYNNYLYSVSATSEDDAWAVGMYDTCYGCVNLTLIEHWDGTSWTLVQSPNVGPSTNYLYAVSATSPDDAWGVGYYYVPSQPVWNGLMLHWDGTSWTPMDVPHVGTGDNYLLNVKALAPDNVWAVGMWFGETGLSVHWDGHGWSVVPGPNLGNRIGLFGVDAVSPTELWAVGMRDYDSGLMQAVSQHYYEPCTTPTPSSTPTLTETPTPTDTSTPTYTPTPTPTPCTISFTDVPGGSTFYPYVRCLACKGVLGGYSDGTFRPGNDITRGQIAKVVSNAAGYSDDVTGRWTYTDVPNTNTFWVWVERLTLHGVMSGYDCGGEGEPCDPQGRPYFRPYNNATRGQLAKIVSNAAGFTEEHTDQVFADVPLTHTFYQFIARLASRYIVGGYPCGGPGEPCDQYNRPYFRPGTAVTRGQAAKITANAFFPSCQTPGRP